jgi:DNA polymerase-4
MPLTTLFVDLNSYFASVEQQLRPELRGRPVAVVPMEIDSTCCLAASYEAKRFGIKTGTNVGEARRRCPDLVLVRAEHEQYIRFHHRVLTAAETCLPIHSIHSIDEFSCRLARGEREPHEAMALGQRVKRAIATNVGECIRCSIGIAPNRFLAKLATDMQKPDGLVVLQEHELPQRLFGLQLIDLPGLGPQMQRRLNMRGISSIEQLCSLSIDQVERLWESIVGRMWWHWLRGHDTGEQRTHRRSIGHQHVLAPALRNDADARAVAVRLLHKAAARARHLGYWTQRLSLSLKTRESGRWSGWTALRGGSQDTLALLAALDRLWCGRAPGAPSFVSVTLSDLVNHHSATPPLFPQQQRRHELSRAIDRLNLKYGRNAVATASMHKVRNQRCGGIAFSNIPDLALPDAIG